MIINCKSCPSCDCRGCNMYELEKALHNGYLNEVMNENKHIDIELLREAVERFAEEEGGDTHASEEENNGSAEGSEENDAH